MVLAAVIVSTSLLGGGIASAHYPRLEIKESKVTALEGLQGGEVRIFIKIRVKNLADHKRSIRCEYLVGAENVGLVAQGAGHTKIPSMRTRSIRTSVVAQDPGNVMLVVEPHCHNK